MAFAPAALTLEAWPLPVGTENVPNNSGNMASIVTVLSVFIFLLLGCPCACGTSPALPGTAVGFGCTLSKLENAR
jgi:hypothetical protein